MYLPREPGNANRQRFISVMHVVLYKFLGCVQGGGCTGMCAARVGVSMTRRERYGMVPVVMAMGCGDVMGEDQGRVEAADMLALVLAVPWVALSAVRA